MSSRQGKKSPRSSTRKRKTKTKRKASSDKKKRRPGRPETITAALIDGICRAIRAGNYIETSALFRGVPKRTFYNWIKRGQGDIERGEDSLYRQLVEDVDEAIAMAEVRFVSLISTAAAIPGNWTPAMTWLERRFPSRWGRRVRKDAHEETTGQNELLEHEEWLRANKTNGAGDSK